MLTVEREYSTPDIPKPWKRKISFPTKEAKSFVKGFGEVAAEMTEKRKVALTLGVEFTPFREIVKVGKNFHVVLTMLVDGQISMQMTNHWSWKRDNLDDEYVTSLFIPSIYTEVLMKRMAEMVKDG